MLIIEIRRLEHKPSSTHSAIVNDTQCGDHLPTQRELPRVNKCRSCGASGWCYRAAITPDIQYSSSGKYLTTTKRASDTNRPECDAVVRCRPRSRVCRYTDAEVEEGIGFYPLFLLGWQVFLAFVGKETIVTRHLHGLLKSSGSEKGFVIVGAETQFIVGSFGLWCLQEAAREWCWGFTGGFQWVIYTHKHRFSLKKVSTQSRNRRMPGPGREDGLVQKHAAE